MPCAPALTDIARGLHHLRIRLPFGRPRIWCTMTFQTAAEVADRIVKHRQISRGGYGPRSADGWSAGRARPRRAFFVFNRCSSAITASGSPAAWRPDSAATSSGASACVNRRSMRDAAISVREVPENSTYLPPPFLPATHLGRLDLLRNVQRSAAKARTVPGAEKYSRAHR